jgi:hypothetical protein
MNADYEDITSQLGTPQWWDENAVPRYCEFEPKHLADIYAREAVYLLIACQNCRKGFRVGMSWGVFQNMRGVPSLSQGVKDQSIHYGDPPNNDCCPVGITMNSIPIRILEFWKRGDDFDWQRVEELEISIDVEWA